MKARYLAWQLNDANIAMAAQEQDNLTREGVEAHTTLQTGCKKIAPGLNPVCYLYR